MGYDFRFRSRFAVGGTASFSLLADQSALSLSPYLAAYPVTRGHHGWFVQAGPQLLRLTTNSPVPEWSGTSATRFAAELSTGYEYRSALLLRAYAMLAVGKGGLAPWLGFAMGWTF